MLNETSRTGVIVFFPTSKAIERFCTFKSGSDIIAPTRTVDPSPNTALNDDPLHASNSRGCALDRSALIPAAAQLRVQRVAERFADQIIGKDGQEDRQSGENRQPPRERAGLSSCLAEQIAPA